MHRIKKNNIFFNKYKMFKISAETFAENYVYNIIDKEKKLWLRNKDIWEKLGVQNMTWLIKKSKLNVRLKILRNNKLENLSKRHGSKLIDGEKFVYTHEDIIMPIIMSWRVSAPEEIKFRSKSLFKQHDTIMSKEQSVITKITKIFSNEKILLQHSVLG